MTEDKHSGIRSDPNRPDDPEYIVRLVGQVIRVSLENREARKIFARPLAAGGAVPQRLVVFEVRARPRRLGPLG